MSKYNREFLTDLGNAEHAEDATEDFEYDNYDDLDDDALLNKIKADHGYEDDELDSIYDVWDSEADADENIDVDGDGNKDLEIFDVNADGKPDLAAVKSGKGSKTAEGTAKTILDADDEEEKSEDDDKHTLDSTGTVSDTDDDDWDDIKDTLSNLKGY